MPHPRGCGKSYTTCNDPCELDASISCSLNCKGLDGVTGEANATGM